MNDESSMRLVENYLTEVSRFLPQDVRDDVVDELRCAIEEQVADEASASDRAPTAADQREVLERFGHPLSVASGYQSERYLIGPGLYPSFMATLKVVMVIVLCAQVVVGLVVGVGGEWTVSVSGLFSGLVTSAFWALAIVVGVFIALEQAGERFDWYGSWRAHALSDGPVKVADRTDLVTNLITEGVFVLWWNDVLVLDTWLPVVGGHLALAQSWGDLYWPFNLVAIVAFGLHAYVLVAGLWRRWTLVAEIATCLALLALLGYLLAAGQLVDVSAEVTAFDESHHAIDIAGKIHYVVLSVLVVVAGFTAWDLWRAWRNMTAR